MAESLTTALAAYGIDYVDAMDRFGDNAELYERLALKYLNDNHYVSLVAAMEAKDYEEGYSQAHSLKGVSGNLSFRELFQVAAYVSDALFSGEIDAAQNHMAALGDAHKKVVECLEAWMSGQLA